MATLVLSTVGNALGGPVGGAIGAMIGQSFDRQLLGPASRGPRLTDLSVQSSSYGTQIPRVYGSMRVAGSVVWATDLIESEQVAGAKGQPDLSYSYSVSLAVALSSRRVSAIRRIWADGKLLRGAEGDFKVPTTFRFYDGSESQPIDPLIGSIEGMSNTPAYRGLALAVFENLELAEFGNRIPFMTFEVVAECDPPTISSILDDASRGLIVADAPQTLTGFASYGQSIATAVRPLVEHFDVPLVDDGAALRSPVGGASIALSNDDLGNSADGRKAAVFEREQLPARGVPSALRLTYYDPARDYQTGEARAIAGEQGAREVQEELAAVLTADEAKTLAQQVLARAWARRDRLTLRLPRARMALGPGDVVQPSIAPGSWLVETCTINGFVNIVELRPAWRTTAALSGDAGRFLPNRDVVAGPTSIALLDVLNPVTMQASSPSVLIAASSKEPGWSARALSVSSSEQTMTTQTAARKSILGRTLTALADAEPHLIDEANGVEIELIDPLQWLTSCDDDALAEGMNLAVLGGELVQFGGVTALSEGRFRLTRLLRARGGTDWACATHAIGEPFCLLDGSSLRLLPLPLWMRGSVVAAADRTGAGTSITFNGESVRPLRPVDLAAVISSGGDLTLMWTRRSRNGFAWLDEVDVPIGESKEQYRVTIATPVEMIEFTTDAPQLVVAGADLQPLGGGAAVVEVRQVGDWAASRPAQLTFELP